VALAAAVTAGLVLSAANPPIDAGPLAFVALIPLLWAVCGSRPVRGAALGFVFGLTYYGVLLYWLLPFGVIAWLPLVVSQAAYVALFGLLLPLLWRQGRWLSNALAGAALWTAVDWARGVWPIGGFTWGGLGYTQHGNGLILPIASVTGVFGVTFAVVVVNAVILGVAQRWGRGAPHRGRTLAGGALVTAAALLVPAVVPLPAPAGRPLDVAVVQGNVPRGLASDRLLQTQAVWRSHVALNRRLAADPPDLAVWPENALDDDPALDPVLGRAVAESIRSVGVPTVVGAISPVGDTGRFYNQALLYSAQGRVLDRYTKIHLVPFGEYVPFHAVLGWTEKYRRGNADLVAGTSPELFPVHGVQVATPICFENVFPDLFRRFVARGANLVVVITNDSSFLTSPASREHVIMSQLRAVETGRWIVQAAISGESAVVSPTGHVVSHTGLFTRTILRADVPTSTARTLYVRLGDWFPWACGLGVVIALALAWRRRRTRTIMAPPAGERGERTAGRAAPLPIHGGSGPLEAGPRVLVVLPTYEERQTVGRVLSGLMAVGPNVHALVIDDGSPDGTAEAVAALAEVQPRIRLLRRPGKRGLASAYLVGFRQALEEGFDVVVEMDSDLSHRPEDLPRLLEGASRFDLTIGSRYVSGGAVTNWSRARLRISKAGNAYARAILGLPVRDATSGYRAYRHGLLKALVDHPLATEGYAFQIELAYRTWRLGYTIGEVPITFREREQGRSKFSRAIVVEALARVTQWGIRDRFLQDRRGSRR
jgi:apolipoprotein N-acyltransferase